MSLILNTTAFGGLFYRNKHWQKLRDPHRIPIILIINLARISERKSRRNEDPGNHHNGSAVMLN